MNRNALERKKRRIEGLINANLIVMQVFSGQFSASQSKALEQYRTGRAMIAEYDRVLKELGRY
jgi:hypothetical protein